ncbi:Benzyl alcohol O-benzoyltransferase [Sesamum angolense]|uniref:Benzyl alcohol O-benzoyltransferase n=1 Tax=Sesamum angolense TaxID=2727404 RepID=A0AAE1T4D7_9LAMI|nr:Benzyl alcohol O-benzoyltransferase [Sesamum angolense]
MGHQAAVRRARRKRRASGAIPALRAFTYPFKNKKGEDGIVVPICLAANAMEVFVKELEMMLKRDDDDLMAVQKHSVFHSVGAMN